MQDELSYHDGGANTGRLLLQKILETKSPPVQITTEMVVNATTEFNPMEAEPFVDKFQLSEQDIANQIQEKIPNFPIKFWQKYKGKLLAKNKTCAKYPNYYDVSFNNIYWQALKTTNGTFYLYSAYYDNRTLVAMKPVVRILGMINRLEPKVKTFCQFWFDGFREPVFAKVFEYKYVWYKKWGNYKHGLFQPYLIGCQIPKGYRHLVPVSVSLAEKPCDTSTTNLRIIYNPAPSGRKLDFAVCVKGLDYLHTDLSVRLVEWLELLFVLGADKVYLYDLGVHPNITKILKYYENIGKVEVTPITLPGEQPNVPGLIHMYFNYKRTNKRQNELIPYNDCLYKNMYRYKFIALLDTDEIIMPKNVVSWKSLMNLVIPKSLLVKKSSRASYNVRNVYFMDNMMHKHGWFDGIPHYMHMLQHVYRSVNYTKPGQYVKCFHNPERVLAIHNHFPLACLGGGCSSFSISTDDAQLQHYREDCVTTLKKSCNEYKNNTKLDLTIWKYKEPLITRVTDTLKYLGFFGQFTGTAARTKEITSAKSIDK